MIKSDFSLILSPLPGYENNIVGKKYKKCQIALDKTIFPRYSYAYDLAEYAFDIESPNEGNSNSIQNTLLILSGISIPLPENFSCHGYDHVIDSSFFRRTNVAE